MISSGVFFLAFDADDVQATVGNIDFDEVIVSMRAMGPLLRFRRDMPMHGPELAPEKRPSVMRATEWFRVWS